MAKKEQQNKIGESFEQNLPDELVPDFIWDKISTTLDASKIPTESTEKIKTSFEEGFNEAAVPPLLWTGIESSLEQTSALNASTESNNKIKTSFEAGHQDIIPENLWGNVENQLEIEGVWRRVLKGLNRRTKRQYWQEKGIQLSIAALALLLLRGCDFGEWSSTAPLANESTVTTKVKMDRAQPTPVLSVNSNTTATNLVALNTTNTTKKSSKNNLLEETYTLPTSPLFSAFLNAPFIANSEITSPVATATTDKLTNILAGTELAAANSKDKENNSTPSAKAIAALDNSSNTNKKEGGKGKVLRNSGSINPVVNASNQGNRNSSDVAGTTATTATATASNENENKTIAQSTLATKTKNLPNSPINTTSKNTFENKAATVSTTTIPTATTSKEFLSETPILALIGQPFIDSTINELQAFEINNVVNKKKHNIRFELGMNGKIGTSLLLGDATNRAMETTSMVKTKTRASGGVGIMLDCYLTANDAIVFGAYPLSNSQQYFGGYTNEGRYYHKEVKLAYFDFTLGYQRTLFHYNDFGTIPSSMYARLDYGLGYLSKSEEIINGLAAELGNSYNKFNHNIGLTVGNTHRINRFVIDYGIYGNVGLSSVQNINPSGTNSIEYSNLATMGGYIGLRYVL
jgi:hypothetical protein